MNSRLIILSQSIVIIILFSLLVAPYIVNRKQSSASMEGMSAGMMQKLFPLDEKNVPIPTVSFTISKDKLDGWDLHVETTNFEWTPEHINELPVADEGHAHLYIDGALTVLMGPWFHVEASAIPPGKHELMVSLNANDHSEFAYQGKPIEAMQTLYAY